jgi:hypothetical protein
VGEPKTLSTDAKMRKEEEEKEGRERGGGIKTHRRYTAFAT